MTFVGLAVLFVAGSALVALVARRRLGPSPTGGRALLLALLVMAALTTVFDNLMIAADLFDYGEEHLLGLRIGQAPIEDYAYPVVALVLLPAVWRLLTERDGASR